MNMHMSDAEISTGYRTAKNKAAQVQILADLNAVPREAMEEKLQELGLLEIPSERIVGTKTAGRIAAFSPGFLPLLDAKTEFAGKWMNLCAAHLGDVGIRDAITCYEYLGNFYVSPFLRTNREE